MDVQNQVKWPPPPSPFLKLNAICCNDLFNWLSLDDLYSLGQTCKRMQRLTSVYFQENFKGASYYTEKLGAFGRDDISAFKQFVQSIEWGIHNKEEDFQSVIMNCDSIREVNIFQSSLSKSMIDCVKVKLNKIETIHLCGIEISSQFNLYEVFLKFCPNLKRLYILDFEKHNNCNK